MLKPVAIKAGRESCPSCHFSVDKNNSMRISEDLAAIPKTLFSSYGAGW